MNVNDRPVDSGIKLCLNTLFNYFGGMNRLKAMCNITPNKLMIMGNSQIRIKLPTRIKNKANYLYITIESNDLYTLHFKKVTVNRKTFEVSDKTKYIISDVYGDMIKDIFEDQTGYYLSL